MAANFVQVATDSTGKKLQTFNNTISTQDVHAEAIVLVDATGNALTTRQIQDTPVNTDVGVLTHAVVYGHTTAGGGTYVEVKAAPSGALQVDGSAVTQPVSGTFWPATQPVSGTFWQATQPVSGTLGATQSGTWTVQPGNTANTTAWKVDGSAVTQPVSGTFWQATQPVSGTFWQATQPVSVAATVTTQQTRSATAATTQVADTNVTTTLLASNANRLGATIQNDSSAVLYVKLGTTASSTNYTVRLVQYAYFELPFGYTGRIDGIWATDPNDGAARITELT